MFDGLFGIVALLVVAGVVLMVVRRIAEKRAMRNYTRNYQPPQLYSVPPYTPEVPAGVGYERRDGPQQSYYPQQGQPGYYPPQQSYYPQQGYYPQRQGMNPWLAGGMGALGGAALGYGLGQTVNNGDQLMQEQGENLQQLGQDVVGPEGMDFVGDMGADFGGDMGEF